MTLAATMTCSAQFVVDAPPTGYDPPPRCDMSADCDDCCAGECAAPTYAYCEAGSHQCYCGCEAGPDCEVDDPRPACGGGQVEACGAGTGVDCVTLAVGWTVNGNPPNTSVCEAG